MTYQIGHPSPGFGTGKNNWRGLSMPFYSWISKDST